MLVLVLAAALQCAELCSASAMSHYRHLLASAGYGRLPIERAGFLIRESDGTVTMELWNSASYQRASFRGSIPPGTVAIAHTHPG